jgi:hypothetical protein
MLLTAARFFGPELLTTGLVANKLTVRLRHLGCLCSLMYGVMLHSHNHVITMVANTLTVRLQQQCLCGR